MRTKLHTVLACSSILLFLMSGTAYGATTHDDAAEVSVKITADTPAVSAPAKALPKTEIGGNINSEKPQNSLLTDTVEFGVDNERVVLEDPRPRTATGTAVSKWLEARANEHNLSDAHSHKGHSHEEAAFVPDMMLGGGWCDMCGCWMRHGCDPNGNCSIGHLDVCGTGYCSLHPYDPCRNSG